MKLPTAKNYGVTRADFPEQDWSVWEARRYNHPGLGQTVDTSYLNIWPCCIHCATWICSSCWDFRRQRADRRVSQYCAKCGGREGFFSAVRHGTRNPHTPDGSHLPKLPFVVPVMSTVGAQWDILGMISYYKDLAIRNSGRAQLWENQVKDNMTEEEAVAAGMLPPNQVDPEEARGWGVRQPDELEHRDPGYSCDGQAVNTSLLKAVSPQPCNHGCLVDGMNYQDCPVHGEEVEGAEIKPYTSRNLLRKVQEALANGCEPTDRLTLTIAEAQQLMVGEYPHDDGEVVVLGPEIFVNVEAEVISWRGENWVKQPAPSNAAAASPDPSWQRREAMDWAVRLVVPGDIASNTANAVVQTADMILEWLQK